MGSFAFTNVDYEFVQVNLVSGQNSKNFGLRQGESETYPSDEPVEYAWLPENDAILEHEFAEFSAIAEETAIKFGNLPGKVIRTG